MADSGSEYLTFRSKRNLETQSNPGYEPRHDALREHTPGDPTHSPATFDQALLICELEWWWGNRGVCRIPSCDLCLSQSISTPVYIYGCRCVHGHWTRC